MSTGAIVERDFTVRAELGLHARPAGRLASAAGQFEAEVSLGRLSDGQAEEWVSGGSVLSILCLAAGKGTRLRVRAVGPQAAEAVEALGLLIEDPDQSAH